MPVRFQVDGDFYDHPKSIGLSDAAVALWTRSGSYSAAKLTDGFIAEHVLVLLSRTPMEAAEELVVRGLWKRTKGGFRFHQWEDRGNLSKERVESERASDRQRKRRARQIDGANTKPQVSPVIVRPDSTPESEGESDRSPTGFRGLSVSVSESVSLPPTPSRKRRSYAYDSDPKFVEFWDVYPSKNGKPDAFTAWQAAIQRGADPDVVIKAAQKYRDDPHRNPRMTKYPQGWLNSERYNDQAETQAAGGWWDN